MKAALKSIGLLLIIGVSIAATSRALNYPYGFFDSLWPGLVGLMVAGWPLIELNAQKHAEKIARNEYPVHWQSWLLRAVIGVALCMLLHAYYFKLSKIVTLALFGACYFGAVFNIKLNLKRGLPALYVGNPDKKRDSLMERIVRWFDGLVQRIFPRLGHVGGLVQLLALVGLMVLFGKLYLR